MINQENSQMNMAQTPGPMAMGAAPMPAEVDPENTPEARKKLVDEITAIIKADKAYFDKAFKRMREDMKWAKEGTTQEAFRTGKKYVAHIVQSYLRSRVSKLYAKNPKATYKKRPRRNYTVYDGDPNTLKNIISKYASGVPLDPIDQAIIEDFQNGTAMSKMYDGLGETIVNLFNYYTSEQKPKFKTQMKQAVRRTLTCGVAYLKLGFQRELEARSVTQASLDDPTIKLQTLQANISDVQDGEICEDDSEMEEIRLQIEDISANPEEMQIMREGLVFDFPKSMSIIPDKDTEQLVGWVGSTHLTHEIFMSVKEIQEIYKIKPEDCKFTMYERKGGDNKAGNEGDGYKTVQASQVGPSNHHRMFGCLWEYYNKQTGLVYTVLEGFKDFLEEPSAPNIEVEGFFPIYTMMFNGIESDDEIFPKSDVRLMMPMQDEWNRAREGFREHRQAARPRYGVAKGMLDEQDKTNLKGQAAHEVVELNVPTDRAIKDVIQQMTGGGIDPTLYSTAHLMEDLTVVMGAQEADMGGMSGGTATEAANTQQATVAIIESAIDELDDFLTELARDAGVVLLMNMTKDKVVEIVGPGAVWPDLEENRKIATKELYLEVQAGSSGRANKAQDLANFERVGNMLQSLQGVDQTALLKELLRRLDDSLDPNDFVDQGSLSIIQTNAMRMPPPEGTGNIPQEQGINGNANAPGMNNEPPGSTAPMGANNQ